VVFLPYIAMQVQFLHGFLFFFARNPSAINDMLNQPISVCFDGTAEWLQAMIKNNLVPEICDQPEFNRNRGGKNAETSRSPDIDLD